MDKRQISEALKNMLMDVANKAQADAMSGVSDIGSIFDDDSYNAENTSEIEINPREIQQAIADIDRAAATKEGAQRLMNGIFMVVKFAARVV